MHGTDPKNEVDSTQHSLVQQMLINLNNVSGTMSGAEDIRLSETSLPFRNSEMAIWDMFSWSCQWPPGIAKAAKRGYRETAKERGWGRTLVNAHFHCAR